jgi:hypothetical protein
MLCSQRGLRGEREREPVFSIAVFDVTGEIAGRTEFDAGQLSPNWLQLCDSLLDAHGNTFAVDLTGPLAHLSLRFTGAIGAAMVTFSACEHLATSMLLLTGQAAQAETELLEMFRESAASSVRGTPCLIDSLNPPSHDFSEE